MTPTPSVHRDVPGETLASQSSPQRLRSSAIFSPLAIRRAFTFFQSSFSTLLSSECQSCQQTVPRNRAIRNCPKKGKMNISLSFRTAWERYGYVTMIREFPFASFLFHFSCSTRNFHAIAPWPLFLRPHLGPSSTLHVLAGLDKLVSVRVTGNR